MQVKSQQAVITGMICFLLLAFVVEAQAMERRRDQFTKVPGHYLVPMPYSLAGVGEGLLLGGLYNNAHDSHTDYIGFVLTGDLEGVGLIASDVHLIDERLIADFSFQRVTKASVFSFNSRGMSSGENDYSILDVEDNDYYAVRFTGTFYERMLEVYTGALDSRGRLVRIRDQDGALIQETSGAKSDASLLYVLGLRLDWTDDYVDPREGLRYDLSRWQRDQDDPISSDYYIVEQNLTAYIPFGKRSTWAFNYFQADAHVTRQGSTDFARVESNAGLDCSDSSLSTEQQQYCVAIVDNSIANNRYGTVGAFGGHSRLRSYPNDRYKGAHARFYGTEFRWNITEEFKPFDIGIAKDVRTGIQLALFYETATVADEKSQLGDIYRDTYGIGARLVTASGLVIRIDYATGDEGPEVTAIVGYPWESF